MSYSLDEILKELNRRQDDNYYQEAAMVNKYGYDPYAPNMQNFSSLFGGADTQAGRDSILSTLQPYDDYQEKLGFNAFRGTGANVGIGELNAYDLAKNYFSSNPLAQAVTPMLNDTQAAQLSGISSGVAGLGQDRALGSTQGQIKAQTDNIGYTGGLSGGTLAGGIGGLGTDRAYGSTQQQILDRQGYTGGLPGQTLAGGIGGLYSDRATASGITGLGTDISGQTTALQNYIKSQIGDVTANQALQDTNLKSILGNVGEGGTLATQLGTRAGAIDKGIEGLQGTGDIAAKSLSDLIGGQTKLGGSIGGLATDFGNFNDQYTNDQAQAELFRTDTRASILGGQQQIQDAMGGNLGQRIDQVARNVDRQRTDQQQDFAGVARLIAANAPPQTQQDLVERGRFRESLDKIRSAIQSNPNIDQRTRATYSALTNSFDANGKLNAVSVKQDGGLVSRSFDDQGQVVINQLGPQGEDMGVAPLSLNVNQLLNDTAGERGVNSVPSDPRTGGPLLRNTGLGAPQV
jgi:hypothetical protein